MTLDPPSARPTVHVVDDDQAVRDSLGLLLEAEGMRTRTFASAAAFLDAVGPETEGCLVLDVRMPGMSGVELQRELEARGIHLPVVFLTAYADVRMAVGAIRAGAVDVLQKPVHADALLERVREALARDAEERERSREVDGSRHRLDRLTAREREVLALVVGGLTNKRIAAELGLSRRTVETHRANIMRKAGADSLPELIRMVVAAGGISRPP